MLRVLSNIIIVCSVVGSIHVARAERSSSRTRDVVPLAAGSTHACALLRDGKVNCWGRGALGDGVTYESSVGVVVSGLTDVVGLAAGEHSACALRADSTVWCWGNNSFGQLGDGTMTSRGTPVAVVGLAGAVQVVASTWGYCARLASGAVRCWGRNNSRQLGDGTLVDRSSPVPVITVDRVTSLAGGRQHFCASTATGLVYCWGDNQFGQTAQSGTASVSPTLVSGLGNVKQVGAASDSSCALSGAGQVQCWGLNVYGELGRGAVTGLTAQPRAPVIGLDRVVRLSHGAGKHVCAIKSGDGQLWCWGSNIVGQLGIGTTSFPYDQPTPAHASTLGNNAVFVATSVDDGPEIGVGFTCVLRGDGGIKCAGMNFLSTLGDGTTTNRSSFVTTILTGPAWNGQDITTGEHTSCASKDNGTAWCWGDNSSGQLGVGDTVNRTTPTQVVGLFTTATTLTAGAANSCALMTDGTAACMGGNFGGSIGDGTLIGRTSATDVVGLVSSQDVISISASYEHHTCVALADGRAKCWGFNSMGQIGDGSVTDRLTATFVYNIVNTATQVSTGDGHSCALLVDGRIKCWGENALGQLGDGTTTQRLLPVYVIGLATSAVAISVGRYHTCAQLVDDTIQCWGANYFGQLGTNTTIDSRWPVTVRTATGVLHGAVALSAGNEHSCAILANGSVTCWGDNSFYQLGDGTQMQRNVATPVPNLSLMSRISAGWSHSCARSAKGKVSCWGSSAIGNGSSGSTTPVTLAAFP